MVNNNDEIISDIFEDITIKKTKDGLKYLKKINECFTKQNSQKRNNTRWIFRGQSNSMWMLETSLKRIYDNLNITPTGKLEEKYTLPRIEQGMIRRFKRQYEIFSNHIPNDKDIVQWLTLIRHYGGPTRILDFTYSFNIALFFAIRDVKIEKENQNIFSIWCINLNWLEKQTDKYLHIKISRHNKDEYINTNKRIFKRADGCKDFVCSVNPYDICERMILQKSTMLMPLNIKKGFLNNLSQVGNKKEYKKNLKKISIEYDNELLKEIFGYLDSNNINEATLFPGLDGFSRYLKLAMLMPEPLLNSEYEGFYKKKL